MFVFVFPYAFVIELTGV